MPVALNDLWKQPLAPDNPARAEPAMEATHTPRGAAMANVGAWLSAPAHQSPDRR